MYHSFLKITVYPAEYITHNSMYEWNQFDNLPVKSVIETWHDRNIPL